MRRVVVIGGGPAGMMAAGEAANNGACVTLLEKNEKLGKKLHITGKGRCNLTNNTDVPGLLAQVLSNASFLNSTFRAMDSQILMQFFEQQGVPLKTERGGRVFPVSDKADDINKALISYLREVGVRVLLKTEVKKIERGYKAFCLYTNSAVSANIFEADAVIIATGGLSYPSTGSTGDGYNFAKNFGHSIIETFPALVPLNVAENFTASLEGLSLRNVRATVKTASNPPLFEELGEMLFTRTGVTGPLILKASAFLCDKLSRNHCNKLTIDLKPALSREQLDARLLRDFAAAQNKNFANSLTKLLPNRLIETIISLSGIPPDKKVNSITRTERQNLLNILKSLPLTPTSTAGYKEAVITKGGVNTREINPSTLMSKLCPGLFFAGEVSDVHAMTGGYNLQIAFSMGLLAGRSAAKY